MWKPLLKCSIIGGLVVYIWYMFSWMILPWHDMVTNRFTDQQAVAQVLMQNAPTDGLYVLPSMKPPVISADMLGQNMSQYGSTDMSNWQGPFVYANIHKGIKPNAMTVPLVVSLITHIIGAFFITLLLLQTKLARYWSRVKFVTIVGFLVGFLSMVPLWNWWGFTGAFTVVGILDTLFAWFFGGLVIARLSSK